MTPEQIAANLSPGAARAVMGMTGGWRFMGLGHYADLFELKRQGVVRISDVGWRSKFRLADPLGQQVKGALLKIEQETK